MEKEKLETMFSIEKRAEVKRLLYFDRLALVKDLQIVNKKLDLKLDELLNSDDNDFIHDILGIQKNVDRKTKKFNNEFLPRFS